MSITTGIISGERRSRNARPIAWSVMLERGVAKIIEFAKLGKQFVVLMVVDDKD